MKLLRLRWMGFELLLVLAGHFLCGAYMKTTDMFIRGDGKGYYDYLPAVFIYHDLNFGFRHQPMPYAQDNTSHSLVYRGQTVNKYPCGAAILWAPFFIVTHEWIKSSPDVPHNGYSLPYHFAVYLAALFYLLAGLVYLRRLLGLYDMSPVLIACIQFILLFATNLYAYAYFEPSFTHVYSFALITMFFYVFVQWFRTARNKYLYAAAALLALVFLLRPFNILVLLFLPFFAGGIKPLVLVLKNAWCASARSLLVATLLFVLLSGIQPLIWFLQCGNFFPWTYTRETFLFLEPELWLTLFGFKKGLFIYTPVLLMAVFAPLVWWQRGQKTQALYLALALLVLHYFIASWQMWWYGGCFGLRPYVDFYAVFALMMAVVVQQASKLTRVLLGLFVAACTVLNLVQVYQYTHNILPPAEMDYQGYRDIFMRTDQKYANVLYYRSLSRDMRQKPVLFRYRAPVHDTVYAPTEWHELSMEPLRTQQGRWVRLNAVIELDCSRHEGEQFYFSAFDSARQSMYYEEMPLRVLDGNDTSTRRIDYSVEFLAPQTKNIFVSFGMTRMRHPRRISRITVEHLSGD